MRLSCAELERYYDAQVALRGKYEGLAAAYSGKHFENMEARAFARQGSPPTRTHAALRDKRGPGTSGMLNPGGFGAMTAILDVRSQWRETPCLGEG